MIKFVQLSLTVILFGVAGGAMSNVMDKARTKVYEILDTDTLTLSFDSGKSEVSEQERAQLKSLLDAMAKDEHVEKFIVAAWSDRDYPASNEVQLPKADRGLADARKESVKKALQDLGAKTVDAYSMAEQPGWISKAFRTEGAKLKGSDKSVKNRNDAATKQIGESIRSKGGAGKVVVIAKREP